MLLHICHWRVRRGHQSVVKPKDGPRDNAIASDNKRTVCRDAAISHQSSLALALAFAAAASGSQINAGPK